MLLRCSQEGNCRQRAQAHFFLVLQVVLRRAVLNMAVSVSVSKKLQVWYLFSELLWTLKTLFSVTSLNRFTYLVGSFLVEQKCSLRRTVTAPWPLCQAALSLKLWKTTQVKSILQHYCMNRWTEGKTGPIPEPLLCNCLYALPWRRWTSCIVAG